MPKAEDLIDELLAGGHRQPIDPKANYRTRRVGLFEETAAMLKRLRDDQRFLHFLEARGVDEWAGYDDAVRDWRAGEVAKMESTMPLGEAALAGIRANGLAWKHNVKLGDLTIKLADEDALKIGDVAALRDQIVERVRALVERTRNDREMKLAVNSAIDDLAACADDPDEVKKALGHLYDQFDYFRVCVLDR